MKQDIIAIVPAAGIGSRMKADKPKQYLMLGNQPIIAHTLDCLLTHPKIQKVIVALHLKDDYFSQLKQAKHPKLLQVNGGDERADSVLAGLKLISGNQWALVHDAARPCLTHQDIDALIASQIQHPQGAILAMPVRDTMKRSDKHGNILATVERELLWHALTPQLFRADELKNNIEQAIAQGVVITDEASAMEWAGVTPGLINGRADNIKVTHPDDLALAALFLSHSIDK
ncbi:2-C-methyl-D-erythritol 4-phosphate cytidylyltransferase [Shewanella intestini]|uniref:2-C-methyl-D-erythritol 4-phosphate cytidylyltransferase n=1 Tax=Shewanella intestini TaxID=2017544 RepID=A0ABS5HXP7_9GAMM|nr:MULTISPECIES: 2-C-methyl-D-erythritol 4-phosphate cytidylyltransferase [Shewanella]MBR9726525.1 2-C-methyl-D-erythritol 4-phosphate cytidylyltransferase [Shewanella intestini]MRG34909.1 2-C-methyl-D-erythritol 4-phosphate cytidylyltransferase [Shewanella sp. XMDDZSB0408]